MRYLSISISLCILALGVSAQPPCVVSEPRATFTIQHREGHPVLTLDPDAAIWKGAASQLMSKDCSRQVDYPHIKTEIKAFWTDTDLYFLFRCPYMTLNLFLPAGNRQPRVGLWDRDVVEMFLGDDWTNIRRYREFEMAPTGDWIDLAIDLDRNSYDHSWRSGWQIIAHIDEANKIWLAAARIPLSAVSSKPVQDGTK